MSAGVAARLRAGVDIGGSTTLAVLCAEDATVLGEVELPTPAKAGGESILDTAAAAVRTLLAGMPSTALTGIGVGAAGVIDPDTGLVVATGSLFVGWAGTVIGAGLSARLGGVEVRAENDVNAFLLGELAAAGQPRNALAVMLGTGVGGALWVDGRLLHGGATGAGEIGHVGDFGEEPCSCGQRGHLEAYASGTSLARRYAKATGSTRTSTRTSTKSPISDPVWDASRVAVAAQGGDPIAVKVFEQAGRCLGTAIAQAGGLLGIDIAILGGGVLRSWPLLENAVLGAVAAQPLLSGRPVTVGRSELGARAVAVGAASLFPLDR